MWPFVIPVLVNDAVRRRKAARSPAAARAPCPPAGSWNPELPRLGPRAARLCVVPYRLVEWLLTRTVAMLRAVAKGYKTSRDLPGRDAPGAGQ